jgi:hypothetical protein
MPRRHAFVTDAHARQSAGCVWRFAATFTRHSVPECIPSPVNEKPQFLHFLSGKRIMLSSLFANLDPHAGRIIGEHFKKLAEQLLGTAAATEAQAVATTRRRELRHKHREAAQAACRAVDAGMEPAAAVALIAARRGLEPERVAGWFHVEQKKPAARMRLRNVKIMRLAARGWTDADIARRYKMHKNSVNRIVRRMLKANPPSLPQLGAR